MKLKPSQANQTKEQIISIVQAIASDESLQIEFQEEQKNDFFAWNQNLLLDEKNLLLPQIKIEENLIKTYRAASDMALCYLLFHDKKIHQAKIHPPEEQKFFDEFEKIRVLAEVGHIYRGMAKNILEKIENDALNEAESLSLILLDEVFAEKLGQKTKKIVAKLEENLSLKLRREIRNLAKKTADQTAFALAVAKVLEMMRQEQNPREEQKSEGKSEKSKNDLSNFGQENIEAKDEKNFAEGQREEGEQQIEKERQIADFKEDEQGGEVSVKLDGISSDGEKIEFRNAYKIFTSKFDEVIFPQKLVSKNELENLRIQLDLRLAKLSAISKKMSLKLKRKLLSRQNSFLARDSSRGILDRKKLVRLAIDPLLEDVWISQKTHEYQDVALTILLDNSGSMRGNPIVMSALACEIIAGILEKFAIKTEIIGFTTADWKGGRARKIWETNGRVSNPGRLNELRHIIYKQFGQNFKKAKTNLGLMLKEGLLKENIDGEALLFARSRLMQRDEKRKILLVISDGTPVDDSTVSANDRDILSDHLRHVIHKIENSQNGRSKIEVVGIGIGHSTEEFYRNAIAIRGLEELGDAMIEKIAELL